jgi:sulfur carrier protein ThiS
MAPKALSPDIKVKKCHDFLRKTYLPGQLAAAVMNGSVRHRPKEQHSDNTLENGAATQQQ